MGAKPGNFPKLEDSYTHEQIQRRLSVNGPVQWQKGKSQNIPLTGLQKRFT